jgi:hypothetical protein
MHPELDEWYPPIVAQLPMNILKWNIASSRPQGIGLRARKTKLRVANTSRLVPELSAYQPRRPDVVIDWPLPDYLSFDLSGTFVYMLEDRNGRPCYVGKTCALSSRIGQHSVNKEFVRTVAWRVRRGERDLDLESILDGIFEPYLLSDGRVRA